MLPRTYARAMAARAVPRLLDSGAVECPDPDRLARVLENAFVHELTTEHRLREEARRLVAAHKGAIRSENADVDTLLGKIVAKLARERGLVLR